MPSRRRCDLDVTAPGYDGASLLREDTYAIKMQTTPRRAPRAAG
jgi:hypothetical protein